MNLTVHQWLQAVGHEIELRRWRDASGGKTKTAVVTKSFEGVSPELILWYMANQETESYKLWHPAHVAIEWETKMPAGPARFQPGATWMYIEYMNGMFCVFRSRVLPIEQSPIKVAHPEHAALLAGIDTDGEPLFWFIYEPTPRPDGVELKMTTVWPEAFPDDYIKAHEIHLREEMDGMVTKAAPYLVQRLFGYQAPVEKLKEKTFIVPAD